MKLVTVGTSYLDIKGFPEGNFIPTGRNAGRIEYKQGGVGRNIAEDAANMGADSVLVSLVDKSGMSSEILERLQAVGVNTDYIRKADEGLGTWLAVFDESGDVCANVSRRANLKPLYSILEKKGDEIFTDAEGIMLEVDADEEVVRKTFELADRHNVGVYSVISNMTIAKHRLEFIKRSKLFICNCLEAGQLFEADTARFSPREMLDFLKVKKAEYGIPDMVVTMGSEGAVFADSDGLAGICPAEQVDVVDTSGAGDSFFAGVVFSLVSGRTMKESCDFAAKVAAKVITSSDNVYNVS